MNHPAIIMRGTPTGGFHFIVTGYKGETILTSKEYESEDAVRNATTGLDVHMKTARKNRVDQLPSTIAHK